MNSNIPIEERSKQFAIRAIKAYSELNKRGCDDAGRVLSKQFLRSSTSVAANLAEAKYAQSNADFISKYSIALKEASETKLWIELMIESKLVSKSKLSSMLEECDRIIRILVSSIKTLKSK